MEVDGYLERGATVMWREERRGEVRSGQENS